MENEKRRDYSRNGDADKSKIILATQKPQRHVREELSEDTKVSESEATFQQKSMPFPRKHVAMAFDVTRVSLT